MSRTPSERSILFAIGAVQFINILDFMMVMPMGPDFSRALGIPLSHVGYVGGSYTAAAAVSGLLGSVFLDRFDRRKALLVALWGLIAATALGGLATGLYSLMAARVVAGLFGGPATSLALSMVADLVPSERRGKALGAVMGAFSVASVLGVPAGLWLALSGWRIPFFSVAGMGVLVALFAGRVLPPVRAHLDRPRAPKSAGPDPLLSNPDAILSWTLTAVVMMAGFIIIPNISSHLQGNLGYPREQLGWLYCAGGAVTFFTARLGGWLVDRVGSFPVGTVASAAILATLWFGFVSWAPWLPVLGLFVVFMASLSFRNVAYNTLTSKVPAPEERARFMSLQSAVQHLASATGAFLSARLLSEGPAGSLVGIGKVAGISMGLTALIPFMLRVVETRIKSRGAVRAPLGSFQPGDVLSRRSP
jgi:predicted MFS family arabinose efflux permease